MTSAPLVPIDGTPDHLQWPHPGRARTADPTDGLEPVEHTLASCCGAPVSEHDVAGTCPIPGA